MRHLNDLLNQFQEFDIFQQSICLGYRGSIAHGTYRPNSDPNSIDDKDLMGICIAPLDYYVGLKRFEQFAKIYKEWDIVIYDIKKFFQLLLKSNPNVLFLLWLEEDKYIYKNEVWDNIALNRSIFASKACYKSFIGYAYSQLKKMENCAYRGYMGTKRKALVERHGYDTKNASHLIRLLQMGSEFLKTGEMQVKRPNRDFLLAIKDGKYTIEEIKSMSKKLFNKIEYEKDMSKLPEGPDFDKANDLLRISILNGLTLTLDNKKNYPPQDIDF